jgi:hypothetical protein
MVRAKGSSNAADKYNRLNSRPRNSKIRNSPNKGVESAFRPSTESAF